MGDQIEEFFDQLGRRGHEPLLEKVSGACRFDIHSGRTTDHWVVRVDRGDIKVFREKADVNCVVRTDRAQFEGITRGEINPVAAILRGTVVAEGELELLILLQRLLPGRAPATSGTGRRDA